ncbi:MAG: TRL-like family protein [Alphaproteobacteria bacterium]|nr:TRL-like family protein [Alphaproteobacteria bacterium]MBN2779542.1 TRL-like family protein [Alphaproteobacteria bacterium]
MKKIILGLGVLLLGGCMNMPTKTGYALFANVKEPLMATDETGTKRGEACSRNLFGIMITGDASIETAKKNGGITKVASVDTEIGSVFMLYGSFCTIVMGE